ncbi:MAG: carbon-nitrogen hydrolase family protein [Candidatus Paceibacterota bacterium]
MKLKIAVAQFMIDQLSCDNNLLRAEKFIKKAADSKAGVVIFPEYFIDGTRKRDLDRFSHGNEYVEYFRNLAKVHRIDIVAGSMVERDKKKLYNTSYYIDRGGEVLGKYRKINLWGTEKPSLSAGSESSVFDTRFGKIGLVICWDLFFPDIFAGMSAKGAELVFCSSYWRLEDAGIGMKYDKNSEIKLIDSICTARAFENGIIFVFCNAAGKTKVGNSMDTLAGHSQIAVPFKGCLKKLPHSREAMFVREVDMDILKDARKVYEIGKDLS